MLLLDTHAFLWFVNGDARLPKSVSRTIQSTEGVYVSIPKYDVKTLWKDV